MDNYGFGDEKQRLFVWRRKRRRILGRERGRLKEGKRWKTRVFRMEGTPRLGGGGGGGREWGGGGE